MTVEVKRRDKVPTYWTAHGMDITTGTTRLLARDVTDGEDVEATSLAIDSITLDGVDSIVQHTTTGTLPAGTYYVEIEHTTAGGLGPFTFRPEGEAFDLLVVLPDLG